LWVKLLALFFQEKKEETERVKNRDMNYVNLGKRGFAKSGGKVAVTKK